MKALRLTMMKIRYAVALGLLIASSPAAFVSPAVAQTASPDAAARGRPTIPAAERQPSQAATQTSLNPDMSELARAVDTNSDGKMSRAEWQAQGLPESSFNMLEKGRGYVTLDDYRNNQAPPGIDLNGDGKLTIEEFKQFDRKTSAETAKSGNAPSK